MRIFAAVFLISSVSAELSAARKYKKCYECNGTDANKNELRRCENIKDSAMKKECPTQCGTQFTFDENNMVKKINRTCAFYCKPGGQRAPGQSLWTCCNTAECNSDTPDNPNVKDTCYTCSGNVTENSQNFDNCLNRSKYLKYRTGCNACGTRVTRFKDKATRIYVATHVQRVCAKKCGIERQQQIYGKNGKKVTESCCTTSLCNGDVIDLKEDISPTLPDDSSSVLHPETNLLLLSLGCFILNFRA